MAKRIIWSSKAQKDRREILVYWAKRNRSKTYSKKLNLLFQEAVTLISLHPKLGTLTEFNKVRSKLVRDYQIFYEEIKDSIHILAIWDTRRNPDKISGIM